jgi:4-amino-4-deoxy-L-arabinose transferase-like glycosyltransferase
MLFHGGSGMQNIQELLWGKSAKFVYLFIATVVLLFLNLGGRELWTQEHRWADIVSGMFYYHDFFHPSLDGAAYYDKPLLSYWFIAGLSFITGHLNTWILRIPSALAGILAIWSIYRIGTNLKDKRLGLVAGWLLLTTFYFIFWARTSSADMLNLAGSLFAVSWYFENRNQPTFLSYIIFFLILSVTALCKGLVGPVVAILAILPDLWLRKSWKKYLRFPVILAMVPAVIIYVLPFWASAHFGGNHYGENGLYLVYRENILRYFQPFDHKDPIYTYFIYLPIYLLPWTFFFLPALFGLRTRWREMSVNSKWIVWATFILFVFFTLSGSRRSYYVLPIVPFAILMTADWIVSGMEQMNKKMLSTGIVIAVFLGLWLLNFGVLQPLYYSHGRLSEFAAQLKQKATQIKPWAEWHFVLLDPESKIRFYLQIPPDAKNIGITGKRSEQTTQTLLRSWQILTEKPADTIIISRKLYEQMLHDVLKNYDLVEDQSQMKNPNAPVAFIPK